MLSRSSYYVSSHIPAQIVSEKKTKKKQQLFFIYIHSETERSQNIKLITRPITTRLTIQSEPLPASHLPLWSKVCDTLAIFPFIWLLHCGLCPTQPLTTKAMWIDGWLNHMHKRPRSLFIDINSHMQYLPVDPMWRVTTIWRALPVQDEPEDP